MHLQSLNEYGYIIYDFSLPVKEKSYNILGKRAYFSLFSLKLDYILTRTFTPGPMVLARVTLFR